MHSLKNMSCITTLLCGDGRLLLVEVGNKVQYCLTKITYKP